jgi:SAM-dependent methyltransferase
VLKIGYLFVLKPLLPGFVWRIFRNSFWEKHWEEVHREQEQQLQRPCPKLANSERAVLIEAICDNYPFASILDLGCAYGQNFDVLSPFVPSVKMLGADSDPARVAGGNAFFVEKGITNVMLFNADITDLKLFESKVFDLVISCASLLYLDPEQIVLAMKEAFRVGKNKLIFVELHREDESEEGLKFGVSERRIEDYSQYWIRNYKLLLSDFVPVERIKIKKIPTPIWAVEKWQEYGAIIEVTINDPS